MKNPIPVIDLFAGCGGFGEGFNSLERDGAFQFDVCLSIEKDAAPLKTLETRAFYHQFRTTTVPDDYYDYVSGKMDRATLFQRHPQTAAEAKRRCLQVTLENSPETRNVVSARIRQAVGHTDQWVLIGGPPCQAYSTIGRARNQSNPAYNAETDQRLELYKEYQAIIAEHQPAVFIMENVRGLLSTRLGNKSIFQQMIHTLTETGNYSLYGLTKGKPYLFDKENATNPGMDLVVKSEEYDIPQSRRRIIILGLRKDITVEPEPLLPSSPVATATVLKDLPPLRSGLSTGDNPQDWLSAVKQITQQTWWSEVTLPLRQRIREALSNMEISDAGRGGRYFPATANCGHRPDWYMDSRLAGILNHETRTHRADDLWRYLFAACAVQENNRPFRISDFPEGLRPRHRSVSGALNNGVFSDRFCVVPERLPSRTVVNHIRKDGHYYIHYDPAQCRSLTVREAARLQTFPDNYFFEGSRTDQFGQVGNAVPPLLSRQIAELVWGLLEQWQNG